MKIYIANVSSQRFVFMWRMLENTKLFQLPIPPRSQVPLPGNMTSEDLDYLVKQHSAYGMISVDQITSSRAQKGVNPLCYSIDKPISSIRMEALLRNNHGVLDAAGKEVRKQLAVVSNDAIVKALAQQDEMQIDNKVELQKVELTIQQDLRDGEDVPQSEAISEGFRMENPRQGAIKQGSRRAR